MDSCGSAVLLWAAVYVDPNLILGPGTNISSSLTADGHTRFHAKSQLAVATVVLVPILMQAVHRPSRSQICCRRPSRRAYCARRRERRRLIVRPERKSRRLRCVHMSFATVRIHSPPITVLHQNSTYGRHHVSYANVHVILPGHQR